MVISEVESKKAKLLRFRMACQIIPLLERLEFDNACLNTCTKLRLTLNQNGPCTVCIES